MTDRAESGAQDLALIEAVISTLPSGVITTDRAGKIVHANRAAAQILRRPRESLVGVPLRTVRGELEAMLWPADKAEVLLLPSAPGERELVIGFSSRTLSDKDGEPGGTVVSFSDITGQKVRERAEEHSRRLADMGKFVSSVAHEIRNPVAAIASLAQVLQAEDPVQADADLHSMVGKIMAESRRIGRLVDDLLAFGRERALLRRKIDVADHVRELLADLRATLPEEGRVGHVPIELVLGTKMAAHSRWDLDPEALRQVVVNLVRNACEAVADRDDAPADAIVEVRLTRGADFLAIAVTDEGVGIPSEDRGRIFDAFFTTRAHGTGLGLSIVQRLVAQMRGNLAIDSTPGQGTMIVVRLPP